ncbi:MAG: hypothetical protein EOO69_02315 [Moraxellaceae bacterium]|nr:MAG: hypothetical protein EOO69_02315 [Moraxellaceae bacterium]
MKNTRPNPELIDDENPEWTDEIFASAVRVTNLPLSLQAKLQNKGGRPVSENPKVSTTVRFDADVLAAFKATGKGWQTRMNSALKEWLAAH